MRSILAVAALLALSVQAEPRLLEPRDGAELAGGSLATIAWSGDVENCVQEWEAFLSVDGGRWFSTRITPHLDAGIRRFTFEVPNVTARDVRILLRFGDERRESEVDVPARFAIRFDPAAVRTPAAVATHDGEPARPGDRGVALWVSGARDGSGLRTFARHESSYSSARVVAVAPPREENAESGGGESAIATPAGVAVAGISTRAASRARPLPRVHDLLLATGRLNV
jgi:hypothetical protein